MKLYWYIEGRSDLVLSRTSEDGYFTEIEVDDETGERWLKAHDEWSAVSSEVFRKIG